MAGRPLKMAERVARFEQRGMELYHDMIAAAPLQYIENEDYANMDQLCKAWQRAYEQSRLTALALEELGNLLRSKAGIGPNMGPWAINRAMQRPLPTESTIRTLEVADGGEG